MTLSDSVCCKCKTESAAVLIRHAYYCRSCFIFVFVGKYRSIITKSRSIARNRGKVLLACSGGLSSLTMTHLTHEFRRVEPHEKKKVQLLGPAVLCHLDESALFGTENTSERLEKMAKEKYPEIPFVSYRMEDVLSASEFTDSPHFEKTLKSTTNNRNSDYEHYVQLIQKSTRSTEESSVDALRRLFGHINKNTAKGDLHWHMKMAMLVFIARREGCSYIFMGDSSTRQAIKMIAMTSKGRGYSVPMDVSVENTTSFEDIVIIRPMKDMLAKEIGFYSHFCGLDAYAIAPVHWETGLPAKTSIDKLTEEFITTLDRDFPSTVSTISRTASKLTPPKNVDLNRRCAMCLMPYQAGISAWRQGITVSEVEGQNEAEVSVDTPTSSCTTNQESCCGGGCSGSSPSVDFYSHVCYSCQINLKDYQPEALEQMPPYVVERIDAKERENSLREQIQEFLLSDNEEEK
ncbi:hypothetical protein BDF14DRAFT_1790886 [Spinellus fusiger]|nr:hypothetical protein BDF14DRAFT_1790886 [Spinellus fusiger]